MSKQLTSPDRDRLAMLLHQGNSYREIGKTLSFHHTTISREIKRNGWQDTYVAIHAQQVSIDRKQTAGQREPLKDPITYAYVLKHLRKGWSPEEISGRLRRTHNYQVICPETIYQFIYDKDNADLKLWEYLPRKQKHRKKQKGRKAKRVRIPDRVSIHDRPEEIETKSTLGHWEGDSVIGRQTQGKVIHTEVERKTRVYLAKLINSKSAPDTIAAQKDIFKDLPNELRQSVTMDNGLEFTNHSELHQLDMTTYFADPYASYQRGSNEYHNGLLRRYLPKGSSFQHLTQADLDDIVWELNHRPRKCLDYQTPAEALEYELTKKGLSGAIRVRM